MKGVDVGHQFSEGDEGGVFEEVILVFALVPFEAEAFFADALDAQFAILMTQPILVAAVPPFGEILAVDGRGVEKFGEDFLDGGQLVEPSGEFGAHGAVEETLIEFFADVVGQARDFTDSGFHGEVEELMS
ncbi:MAG TPA: hypothetical protein VGI88_04845 [Verrucomicrobiae bacterium]